MAQVTYRKIGNSSRDISVQGLSISVPGKHLLIDTTLKLVWQHRYVLISANGTGKSTLLKSLMDGSIPIPEKMTKFLVGQELENIPDDWDCFSYVFRSDVGRDQLEREERDLEDKLVTSDSEMTEEILEKLEEISLQIRSYSRNESDVYRILWGLGFDKGMMGRSPGELSGGWRMRLSLARALWIKPDLLLLDEPTNHLDLRSIIRLSSWLSNWKSTLLCVTHDRELIDDIATNTLMLMEKDRKLRDFRGSYEDTLGTLESEGIMNESGYIFDFGSCNYACPVGASIKVSDVSFGYGQEFVLEGIDFCVDASSRVVIIGENGCGKTTVFKLLMGMINPTSGYIEKHRKLRTAYFAQHVVDTMPGTKSALHYISRHNLTLTEMHQALSKFGLIKTDRNRKLSELSGGQRTRVVLADIYLQQPHILILDEISNHLDLESVMRLSDAIERFPGGIIMASHDRQLLNIVSNSETSEIWGLSSKKLSKETGRFGGYCSRIKAELNGNI